jgi:hypothetical protein
MTFSVLAITDGTTRINLLSGDFRLNDWTPALAAIKGGGAWTSSPFQAGRRPVVLQPDNVIETFNLIASGESQNKIIQATQELRRLLEKAREYWTTDWSREPVWIEAQGLCETNLRYSVIYDYRTPNDDNPFIAPFAGAEPAMDAFTLIIERGYWTAQCPLQVVCVPASTQYWSANTSNDSGTPGVDSDDCHVNRIVPGIFTVGINRLGSEFGNVYDLGIRFPLINVPNLANIVYAYAVLTAPAVGNAAYLPVKIYGEKEDNPVTFTTYANWVARNRTLAYKDWSVPALSIAGTGTPNLKEIAQEIVDRPGWVANNAMVLFFESQTWAIGSRQISNFGATPAVLWVYYTTIPKLGRSETCNIENYIQNMWSNNALTSIWKYDAAPVTWTQLIGTVLPWTLYPIAPAVGDILYLGATYAFNNLCFNSIVAQSGMTLVWEYWNGAWVALSVQDNTNQWGFMGGQPLNTAGVGSVHWNQPADWVVTAVNAVNAFWVRLRCTVAAAPVPPTQDTRYVYTAQKPYLDIAASRVTGDVPALLDAIAQNSSDSNAHATTSLWSDRLLIGLRSISRGADFGAFINFNAGGGFILNPPGITGTAAGASAFALYPDAPLGNALQFNPVGAAGYALQCTMTIDYFFSKQYYGMYRAFLRGKQVGGVAGDIRAYLAYGSGAIRATTQSVTWTTVAVPQLLELGLVKIPDSDSMLDLTPNNFAFEIWMNNTNVAPGDIFLYDLILLPVDEWAIDTGNMTGSSLARNEFGRKVEVSSTNPKENLTAVLQNVAPATAISGWAQYASGQAILQANETQRLWFLSERYSAAAAWTSEVAVGHNVNLNAIMRYLGMRGDR